MYIKIYTQHAIYKIRYWLEEYRNIKDNTYPVEFILELLTKIMQDKLFQFGNMYWRQLFGVAMGTSVAVNYVNIYVGILENNIIFPKYKNNLLYYGCFIDNTLSVWIIDPKIQTL